MTTAERATHVDLLEAPVDRPGVYQHPCSVCGAIPSPIRVLEWSPPRGPKGVPAWSVRATYFCAEHRVEAMLVASPPASA